VSVEDKLLADIAALVAELVDGFDETVELDDGTTTRGRLPGLIALLDAETRGATGQTGGGSSTEARIPIFTPAYDALLLIAATAMRCTGQLGGPVRVDVRDALRGVVGLAAGADKMTLMIVRADLKEAVSHARHVLSIDLPPIHLRGIRCPHCRGRRVLASRREHSAWCANPDCVDPEKRRYVWQGEVQLRLLGAMQAELEAEDTPPVTEDPVAVM
jgi:DNA-directed RNA polymerase subunit RPC12/RpoP